MGGYVGNEGGSGNFAAPIGKSQGFLRLAAASIPPEKMRLGRTAKEKAWSFRRKDGKTWSSRRQHRAWWKTQVVFRLLRGDNSWGVRTNNDSWKKES